MSRTNWTGLPSLTVLVACLMVGPGNVARFSFFETAIEGRDSFRQELLFKTNSTDLTASPCATALTQRAVCMSANKRVIEIMSASHLEAITVVQDVRTGAIVAFAASQPSSLDVTTPVSPLSLSKLLLSASWWDNRQPDSSFDSTKGIANAQNPANRARVSIHEMLVGGSDSAGRQMAMALRKAVGTKVVMEDFKRYGFGARTNLPRDEMFWGELAPTWKTRLVPAAAYVSLSDETTDVEWAEVLSIGESNMQVTALHVSRFLQAIGNNGMMLIPVAREYQSTPSVTKSLVSWSGLKKSTRVMQQTTALRLQSAMRDTVQRGTAESIARALENTGWQIGGKTGSGPALLPKGPQVDGWFAGLIFDPQAMARFTVATFVRSGGRGGENAARISAKLARYIIGDKTSVAVKERADPTIIYKGTRH